MSDLRLRLAMTSNNKQFFVYILTNRNKTVLYTDVTSNLVGRLDVHKKKSVPGFTNRYNADQLVYLEPCPDAVSAITREKQFKAGSRRKKILLIEGQNKLWEDLSTKF